MRRLRVWGHRWEPEVLNGGTWEKGGAIEEQKCVLRKEMGKQRPGRGAR